MKTGKWQKIYKVIGIETIVPLVLMLVFFVHLINFNLSSQKVVVVHSYDPETIRTKEMTDGINTVFHRQYTVQVYHHYMEGPGQSDPAAMRKSAHKARRFIDEIKPSVLITTGDDAQQFVAVHYLNQPNISICFAGVNRNETAYDFEKALNVTGILRRFPQQGLNELLLAIADKKKMSLPLRIAHVGDDSDIVKYQDEFFRQVTGWDRVVVKPSHLVPTFAAWKRTVLGAEGEVDVLILSSFRNLRVSDVDDQIVSAKEVMAWTLKHSKIPVVGIASYVVSDGGPIALSPSVAEQGHEVASRALQILQGHKKAKDMPITHGKEFILNIRERLLTAQGIELPQIYPAFAKALNKLYT